MNSSDLMAPSTGRRYSEHSEDTMISIRDLIQPLQRIRFLQEWADANLKSCSGCDTEGRTVLKNKAGEWLIGCPRLSRDCEHGQRLQNKLKQLALSSVRPYVPALYCNRLSDAFATDAIRGSRSWDFTGILYFYGTTGTGKSFGAAWVLYNRILQALDERWNRPTSWSEVSRLPVMWVSAYRAADDKLVRDAACKSPLLVLDDLGEEVRTPSTKGALGEIISDRYNGARPTIITSNIGVDKLADIYSPRMVERIVQTGQIVPCYGKSLRLSE